MTHRLLSLALIVALGLGIANVAATQDTASASVVVTVPADARLCFNGTLMKETGTERRFTTPPLQPGADFYYEIKAEVTRQGQVIPQTQEVAVRAGETTRVDFSGLGTEAPAANGSGSGTPQVADAGWPRKVVNNGTTLTVYQPQIEKWERNQLEARAAVSVATQANAQPTYGVMWISARTEVAKENGQVTLANIKVTRATFPSAPDKVDAYLAILRKQALPETRTVALDRLEANLAVTKAEARTAKVAVKNEPPRIINTTKPALLVLIDGQPALRQVQGSNLLRIINTRALILLDQSSGKHYLHVMDRWLEAAGLDGPWSVAQNPPAALAGVLQGFTNDPQVNLFDDVADDLKEAFENGAVPTIYVSTVPAELIETTGAPDFAPIDGTKLLWAKNSTNQLLLNTVDQKYYVLLSGRWFRGKSLEGPWEFVASDKLPADFAKIPEAHPRADVLSSVSGTPQAGEALIANQIPQTATIKRSEAKLTPVYDGQPQFQPIENTSLNYAVNSPTPVIQVDPNSYYAVENGVWFTSPAATGPWVAATSVPPAIYSIPPDAPLYYVTNTYIYDATPDYIYTGYTPGYFGTCVCPEGVVVYGTGWTYRPWIGSSWFGWPWTYGWGVHFDWTAGGWGFGFATGCGRPWWGPVGWYARGGGAWWRPGWQNGWGGRYANAHINHFNFGNVNVYHRWNDNVRVNTFHGGAANVSAYNRRTLNNVVAGPQGDVYRRAGAGWETHTTTGWRPYSGGAATATLNNDWAARRYGEANASAFRSAAGSYGHYGSAYSPPAHMVGGYAGFHGGAAGYRSSGGGGYRGGGGFHGGRR